MDSDLLTDLEELGREWLEPEKFYQIALAYSERYTNATNARDRVSATIDYAKEVLDLVDAAMLPPHEARAAAVPEPVPEFDIQTIETVIGRTGGSWSGLLEAQRESHEQIIELLRKGYKPVGSPVILTRKTAQRGEMVLSEDTVRYITLVKYPGV